MCSLEDVASCLHKSWVFGVFNDKTDFVQIKLDEKSILLTIFNKLFGRYRWKMAQDAIWLEFNT